ncbi:hypothetical protein [Flavobacterium sp. XS2P39]|uniref:hypothetical protein n=1 Tax=Flavobacterium sp. XS2P39 TaxID=3401725 RepID=UPI003AAD9369
MDIKIPEIDNEFLCIANSKEPTLTAVVLSYLSKEGKYLPVFQFMDVTIEKDDYLREEIDEHDISRRNGHEFNVKIINNLHRIGDCKFIIIVGLTEKQKSYLSFLNEFKVIDIQDFYDADLLLKDLTDKTNFLSCNINDIHYGLFKAVKSNLLLKIEEHSERITETNFHSKGLIVIENILRTSTIISVNYALSIGANIIVITPPEIGRKEIKSFVENWQGGDYNSFLDLSTIIYQSVEFIEFINYEYATFFTKGIPYSLILNNVIPFTHVHLYLNPDFFIFNNLYFENHFEIHSAIVFSPLEFSDEETDFVIKKIEEKKYYVKKLIGNNASVYNIDMHVKEFPFNILHFCSHGGEVDGYSVVLEFIDRFGTKHKIEYDEVVSLAPTYGEELISVTTKMIWRKFNGLIWGSKEFKKMNYENYIFSDMQNMINKKEKIIRVKKDIITDSCAIKCCDFGYQAMFNFLAASYSPIIFNNTCWSGADISHHFISVGARGYVGTLWNINNNIAKNTAERFYEKLFDNSILDSLQSSLINTLGTKDENVYIFWGLHFTSLKSGASIENSKMDITYALFNSLDIWKRKLGSVSKKSTIDNIKKNIQWNANQIMDFFRNEAIEILNKNKFNQ